MDRYVRATELTSVESEERFRQVFLSLLQADGYSETEAHKMIFKTPSHCHRTPSDDSGVGLLAAFRGHYQNQLPYSWYFEGLNPKTDRDSDALQITPRPITLVVIPGIFGEFIQQLPFHSVVENMDSYFSRRWQASLEQAQDETYSLRELAQVPRSLSQLVRIGSLDQGDRTLCNVVVLNAELGSLETIGSLESNVEVYRRRLEKTFKIIDEDQDIYLIGYSRGLAVALALVSAMHEESKAGGLTSAERTWFAKLKGVVGLGGVFYGAQLAEDVLSGKGGNTSKLVTLLRDTADALQTFPDDAGLVERGKIVAHNVTVRTQFLKSILEVERAQIASGRRFLNVDLQEVYARERRFRLREMHLQTPNASGMFALVNGFFRRMFNFKDFDSQYNENILARKQLVRSVLTGVQTLTPKARDAWWQTHELPEDLLLFSLTGLMPDAYLNDFHSPLSGFEGFGPTSSDYNVVLRGSYYDVTASENTQINDSQMSHFASRYWQEMYASHHYRHYYLGVLGTHHWGMGFPFTIKDDHGNAYPRATLLKAVASFISSLECKNGVAS